MKRTLLATALAISLVAVWVTPAGAQGSNVMMESACNTATGEYDLDFTLFNSGGSSGAVAVDSYTVDGVETTPPVFAPDPIAASGQSFATDSVPGDTTSVAITVIIDFGQIGVIVNDAIDLDGDCEAPATTTTTTSTTLATTTTTTVAPAARAIALQPAFTG